MAGIQRHGAGRAIRRLNPDLADDAAVAVPFGPIDPHFLVEHHPGEILLRPLAEGLGLLGGVDATEANLVLLAVGIQDGYRVAISYTDHAAEQGVGVGDTDQQCR